jgi:hypothetical protein
VSALVEDHCERIVLTLVQVVYIQFTVHCAETHNHISCVQGQCTGDEFASEDPERCKITLHRPLAVQGNGKAWLHNLLLEPDAGFDGEVLLEVTGNASVWMTNVRMQGNTQSAVPVSAARIQNAGAFFRGMLPHVRAVVVW